MVMWWLRCDGSVVVFWHYERSRGGILCRYECDKIL